MSISWQSFGNRLIQSASVRRVPIAAQLELTSRCNLRCKMCYVCSIKNQNELINKERTAKEWIELARQAKEAGVLYLLLTGGEVFIRKDFREIYEAISEMGFIVQIYSNGTLITPEIAKWLGKRPPAKISITMYGASPETYQRVTGHADAYERAVRGVDLLREEGILTKIRTTVIRDNRQDIDKLYEFAVGRDIEFGTVFTIIGRREGNDTDPSGVRLSAKEVIEFEDYFYNYLSSRKRSQGDETAENKIIAQDIEDLVEKTDIKGKHNNAFKCSAGHSSFWVTWDGRMTPCGSLPEPSVDVFSLGMEKAWEELKRLADEVPQCGACEVCKYKVHCSKCPAKLYVESGGFTKCAQYLRDIAYHKELQRNAGNF